MALETVQCRLQAPEKTLKYLWRLMSDQNTPLVNQTLETIRTNPEINKWISQGYIPNETIEKIIKNLKQQPEYQGVPGRFHDSAEKLVKEVYQSWFAVQLKKRISLKGKKRWLAMLKSEEELLQETSLTLPQLQTEAAKNLKKEQKKLQKIHENNSDEKLSEAELSNKLFFHLIDLYEKIAKDCEKEKKPHLKVKKILKRCAIVYLLKNKCKISDKPEDPEAYKKYRKRKEIQIERLEHQLRGRLPKGREHDPLRWSNALESAQKISKKYRKNLHEWSYKRLSKAIESQAVKKGIDIEYILQKYIETPDLQAKNMVLNAYEQRKQLVK